MQRYLDALELKGRLGDQTAERARARLAAIQELIVDVDPLQRVVLVQERLDLEAAVMFLEDEHEFREREQAFIRCARSFSESRGIRAEAWRRLGVPPSVLVAAGLVDDVDTRGRDG